MAKEWLITVTFFIAALWVGGNAFKRNEVLLWLLFFALASLSGVFLPLDLKKCPEEKTMTDPDTDFHAWAFEAAERTRARQLTEEDYDLIAEQLEDMGRNDRNKLESHLRVLLMHLLKWEYQPQSRTRSWRITLRDQREAIATHLKRNPSLRPRVGELGESIYRRAVFGAMNETGREEDGFPATFSDTG